MATQAEAARLTLLEGKNSTNPTGYIGVHLVQPGQPKPYQAKVWRGGKQVSLGSFATAAEAVLCFGQTPEGRDAAKPPMTSEEARQLAEAEGLTLLRADNKTGYYNVHPLSNPGKSKPYQARLWRGGHKVSLGTFATAEEAALCFARSPEGQAVAKREAAAPPLTSEEARQQAEAEGLTLALKADNKTGYFGVYYNPSKPRPYEARVSRRGKPVPLGFFATAEEALTLTLTLTLTLP